jgi:glutamate-1-semialdehyde 2,1-aminomutase
MESEADNDVNDSKTKYMKKTPTSEKLWKQASQVMPGGVTANIKYFEPYPVFMKKAKGSRLYDVDGNEYVDYCLCLGPLILGHGHPAIVKAIRKQLEESGTTMYGTPHELEIKLANEIRHLVPCAEMVRFVSSGLEATLHAIKVARAYAKKVKIAKFEGHYHGAHDYAAVSVSPPLDMVGPSNSPASVSNSAGLPGFILENTLVLPFNDSAATERLIEKNRKELATVIVEPVMRGFLPPEKDFLKTLRTVTEENDIVLIFDEVMTGFRFGLGGAQQYFNVTPDMVALGKVVGGGLPIGVFAGKREMMELSSPIGGELPSDHVFHSGTFNGCPTVLAAGLATIEVLKKQGSYRHINWVADEVKKQMKDSFEDNQIEAQVIGLTSMFQCLFTLQQVRNYRDITSADSKKRVNFDLELINNGVYVRPGRTYYTSLAHTKLDLKKTSEAIDKAARAIKT